ncbi:hypothetical protein EZV62_018495 [Acer yangbiense]|uniref:CCHC-type domain-containing protein n=1 Tax=Acer yangbiense TaxID=1000413 RepID=A0A5C7HLF6_9ROSI|nr:hypothetical protein EZV62_018495 [Acer yangbiense]
MNSEELAMLCSALSIKEKERKAATLDSNLKTKGERLLTLCLVGKVLTTKLVNKDALINVLSTIWRTKEGVEIEALEGNVFAVHFKNTDDKKFIQSGGPWTFNRAIIAFEKPSGTGKVSDVDLLATKNCCGHFVRARVTISIDVPLMRSLRVDLLGTRSITTMLLWYERLQDYCFKCSKLGHSLRDCPDQGDEKEVTTEAQLRLNVWLHSKSPPTHFNHRNDPHRRRIGGYQGGNSNNGVGQGNWRSGESLRRSDKGEGSEIQAGNRSWLDGKSKSQVGELKSLEPIKINLGKRETFNALREKALSGEGSAGSKLKLVLGKELQPLNRVSINGGKDKGLAILENLMEVDTAVLPAVFGPASGPSYPIRVLKPIGTIATQTIKLEIVSKSSGPVRPAESSKIQATEVGQAGGLIIQDPKPSKNIGGIKAQKVGKWKRAARAKDRDNVAADLGEFLI